MYLVSIKNVCDEMDQIYMAKDPSTSSAIRFKIYLNLQKLKITYH